MNMGVYTSQLLFFYPIYINMKLFINFNCPHCLQWKNLANVCQLSTDKSGVWKDSP